MSGRLGRLALICVLGALGCVDGERDDVTPPGSGGAFGGVVEEDSGAGGVAGVGGSGGSAAAEGGRCGAVTPGMEARIDDFEDGNLYPIPEPGRSAAWTTRDDGSGGTITLSVDQGGADGSDFAAHVVADGFTGGASFDLGIRFMVDAVSCPYDAGRFTGVSFFSKGTGRIELRAQLNDVFSTEFGGTCDDTVEQCWDFHRKLVPLADEWTYHEIPWDAFSQAGWGKYVVFDPSQLIGLSISIAAADMPMDLWIDQVRFSTADGDASSGP